MLAYRDAVDGLYSFSVAESLRSRDYAALIEARTARGQWGRTDADDADDLNSPSLVGDRQHHRRAASRLSQNDPRDRDRDTDSPIPGAAALAGLKAAVAAENASSSTGAKGDEAMLVALRQRLGELASEFRTRLATLLGDLLAQPDPDMKFLGVVMNFNDVYKPVRRKRREKGADKERGGDKGKGKEEAKVEGTAKKDREREKEKGGRG